MTDLCKKGVGWLFLQCVVSDGDESILYLCVCMCVLAVDWIVGNLTTGAYKRYFIF